MAGSVLGLVLHGIGRALRLVLGLVDGLVRRVGRDRNGVAHRVVRLLGVLGHLRGDALARRFDLVAKLVVLLRERRLDVVGGFLHALRGLAVQLLTLGGHVLHDFLTLGRGILIRVLHVGAGLRAQLLRLAPCRAHLIGDHSARFLTRPGGVQQRDNRTGQPTSQKSSKFVAHDGLLRDVCLFVHYRGIRAAPCAKT